MQYKSDYISMRCKTCDKLFANHILSEDKEHCINCVMTKKNVKLTNTGDKSCVV